MACARQPVGSAVDRMEGTSVKKIPVKHHTPAEKMAMRRAKRKNGPAAMRRKERRLHLQPKPVAEKEYVE